MACALRCCSSVEEGSPPPLLQPVLIRTRDRHPPQASAASRESPSDPGRTPHSTPVPAVGPVGSGWLRPTHKEQIPSYRCPVTRSRSWAQASSTTHSGLQARALRCSL
ncbi:hypothetical protein NDU88_002994 [Pleurodeles waltl]|uniref:Uncharacterized protein n=1 Tax=Pleurodeles waltl TaxID=8319 RepID=A0AAV7WTD5_PLEWA|nr:hypothetical protein NDU88_002994 [Pleurodeles waltl]